jgi:lipid II:glycine glycyltransferase (peptidoglycan interpeptide bridge formation enzyme)
VTLIITLLRKSWNVKMAHVYYAENTESKPESSIISYTNALRQLPTLQEQETYQIDLTLSEEQLFRKLNKSNRSQIKQATTKSFTHCIEKHPSNEELLNFQQYYNHFAKDKNTHQCNSFHLKTLQLLRDKNALIVSKILDDQNEVFCYRVYLTDYIRALSLYSASHFRKNDVPEIKRLYSLANRYLLWKNILWFKQNGHAIYDLGSLTNDENIRQFKIGFGGEVVKAYSGYASNNRIGKFVLWIRKVKMNSPYKNR